MKCAVEMGSDAMIYVGVLIKSFSICSTTKRIFLGWFKEVRTTKSQVCGAQGGICRVNTFFNPVACCFLYKAKDLSAHPRTYRVSLTSISVETGSFFCEPRVSA
jgi:hypothetical protein